MKEGDEEADRGNDGKTTSKSGLVLGKTISRVDWPWGRQHQEWTGLGEDNIKSGLVLGKTISRVDWSWGRQYQEWTGLEWTGHIILRKTENRKEWRKLVVKSPVVPQRGRWRVLRSTQVVKSPVVPQRSARLRFVCWLVA